MVAEHSTKRVPNNNFKELSDRFDRKQFQELNKIMSFAEYLDLAIDNPVVALSSYQRIYHMILKAGVEPFRRYNRPYLRYNFFAKHSEFPIFGLEGPIAELVKCIQGAAGYYGTEKRILLLHGPVGSSKSTVARALKRGLEKFSKTSDGALYTFTWKDLDRDLELRERAPCPMHDDPLKLIPVDMRPEVENRMNQRLAEMKLSDDKKIDDDLHRIFKVKILGEPNPHDSFFLEALLRKYNGDWGKVMTDHIEVSRVTISESKRVGIGTFQPKDEKNQDATELTGDVNYMKLGKYGQDSDPRAFNFDGEFMIAHRGIMEFIEVLKLNQEFLYDLLGAAQERQVKPKKFPQVSVDLMIIGHTNSPEYKKLEKNECMEALRDRTIRVDWPYAIRWDDEVSILKQDYCPEKVRQHIAPHTISVAALFAVLTRLNVDKNANLSPVKKAKLYNGQSEPGFTEDSVKEMMDADPTEGMDRGISARFIQNKISNALVSHHDYVNPFMVLHEIREGLKTYSSIGDDEGKRAHYENCVELAKKELEEILKNEVRRALTMNDDAVERMFTNYLDNVTAYINDEKVKNEYTNEYEEPNERLMRAIEEKIDVPETNVSDFRRSIAAYVGTLIRNKGKEALKWDSHPDLARALEMKLFDDTKDSIKLSSLTKAAEMVDPSMKEKIDLIRQRLVKEYGYNEQSARDVLQHVASLFARGDIISVDG